MLLPPGDLPAAHDHSEGSEAADLERLGGGLVGENRRFRGPDLVPGVLRAEDGIGLLKGGGGQGRLLRGTKGRELVLARGLEGLREELHAGLHLLGAESNRLERELPLTKAEPGCGGRAQHHAALPGAGR